MITTRAIAISSFKARSICISLTFLVALVVGLTLRAGLAHAATFTVTNTNDSGVGSLRQAIAGANANSNPTVQDVIEFDIQSGCDATTGVCTISPTGGLPDISQSVIVDGYSQSGASPNTLSMGNDAQLKIELNGTGAGAMRDGIRITGSNSVVRGLIVNRWGAEGIEVNGTDADDNTIEGNFIGTDASGNTDLGNLANGVVIAGASNTVVGGVSASARNIISGNDRDGIFVGGPGLSGNRIEGNYIGTNASGQADLGNGLEGVEISNAPNTVVGGTSTGARNVISGNGQRGVAVFFTGATGNRIEGNFVGMNVSGTADLGNSLGGVVISQAPNNTVGGSSTGARNVISGNDAFGVLVGGTGAGGNTVAGNYVGTDETGTQDLGNSSNGVELTSVNNAVGGTSTGARNVVSGNNGNGVVISGTGTSGNTIQGNYIGTDESGTQDLGNSISGVSIALAPDNTIGGSSEGARNVVSGNNGNGFFVNGAGASSNTIEGNHIGTDESGAQDLGNNGNGVAILDAPINELVANVVSGNGLSGVFAQGSGATGNSILRNSIFDNDRLGIDLNGGTQDPSGVTANDPQDPDTGPNNLQNFPVVTSATTSATSTTINATLNSVPSESYTVQFFSNLPGEDEGRTFIGQTTLTTDASGDASTTFSPAGRVPVGRTITATATRTSTADTSEFSAARTVADGTPPRVVRVVPAENATNVNPATNVTAFFSEAMNQNTINQNTFTLRKAGQTQAIPATRTYDAATRRAILDPSTNLERGATYIATVTPGARDVAGNQLDQDPGTPGNQSKIWRFTTRP